MTWRLALIGTLLCLALGPSQAGAATLVLLGRNAAAWGAVDRVNTGSLPPGAVWAGEVVRFPSADWPDLDPCQSACSPFDPGIFGTPDTIGQPPLPGWQNLPFWAVWAGKTAVLSFTTPKRVLRFLWGSPDRTNSLEFLNGAEVIARIDGSDLPNGIVKSPGQGAAWISVEAPLFDRLRLTSQEGAFELSNIEPSQVVPVPGALVLLSSGLLVLGMLRRRPARKKLTRAC